MCNVLNRVLDTWLLHHDHPYYKSKVLRVPVEAALQDHNYYSIKAKGKRKTSVLLEKHLFNCTLPVPQYVCKNCNFRNHFHTLLLHHIHDFENNYRLKPNRLFFERKYCCDKCTYQTYSRLHLLKHVVDKKCSKVAKSDSTMKFRRVKCLNCCKAVAPHELKDHWCRQNKLRHRKRYSYPHLRIEDIDFALGKSVKIRWFQCSWCPFIATRQTEVMKHECLNKQKSITLLRKCQNCNCGHSCKQKQKTVSDEYKSEEVENPSLLRTLLTPCDNNELESNQVSSEFKSDKHFTRFYQCGRCSFKSTFSRVLTRHVCPIKV